MTLIRSGAVGLVGLCMVACGARTELASDRIDAEAAVDAGTNDASSGRPIPCERLASRVVRVTYEIDAIHSIVDVLVLQDATASMLEENLGLGAALSAGFDSRLLAFAEDVALGLVFVGDYYSGAGDAAMTEPFPIGTPVARLVEAFARLPEWNGGDGPEAQTQALFAVATTDALYPVGPAECAERHAGRACFRPDAARIIVLGTDAPFHEGPGGTNPYEWTGPPPLPVTFDQAIEAVHAIDAHVVGIFSGPPEYANDLRTTVTETGSVEVDGSPVFVEIPRNGLGVDDGLVRAVERYLTRVPFQVTLDVRAGEGDVIGVHPVASTLPDAPRPIGSGFADVIPGTRLTFEIDVGVTAPTTVRVVTRANGREELAAEAIAIDVDGMCAAGR